MECSSTRIHFAPLQGYTTHAYRCTHARHAGGVDCYYTPFIRWERGDVRGKDVRDILPENNEGVHLIPQVICGTSDDFNRLCDMVQGQGYSEIDVNMGCPAPMQTKLHRGSGILAEPDRVEEMVREMLRRPEVTFSVKMRLGLHEATEWQTLLPMLNECQLGHITLHPRIGKQMYKGEVNMQQFRLFAEQCKHPLIYNGDLKTVQDVQRVMMDFPHLHGVMIGRGLLARPTLAAECAEGVDCSVEHRREVVRKMHGELLDYCRKRFRGDSQILMQIRPFWEYQEPWMERKQWKRIMKAGSMRNYLTAVADVLVRAV